MKQRKAELIAEVDTRLIERLTGPRRSGWIRCSTGPTRHWVGAVSAPTYACLGAGRSTVSAGGTNSSTLARPARQALTSMGDRPDGRQQDDSRPEWLRAA